jgi:hypothetical protein
MDTGTPVELDHFEAAGERAENSKERDTNDRAGDQGPGKREGTLGNFVTERLQEHLALSKSNSGAMDMDAKMDTPEKNQLG